MDGSKTAAASLYAAIAELGIKWERSRGGGSVQSVLLKCVGTVDRQDGDLEFRTRKRISSLHKMG